jgi:putative nucleotidyltransferase with HDIG domain
MRDSPRSQSRKTLSPESARVARSVFARFLAVCGAVSAVAVATTVAVLRITGSPGAAQSAGLVAGIFGSSLAAVLWSLTYERRLHQLIRAMDRGLPVGGAEPTGDLPDRLLEEVVLAWQRAVVALDERAHEKREEARRSYEALTGLIRMMAKAVDERVAYLRGHSERVAQYAEAIARDMGLPEEHVERIRLAALLHDIGILGVEDHVALKETPLSPEEFEIVKAHTVKGAAILRPIGMLHDLIPGVELHHESLDGMGYPYGLKGDEIPLMARIISVADSFDAMTTHRPYQAAMNPDYVLEILGRLAGKRYDPTVVAALSTLVRGGVLEVRNVRPPVSFRMRRPVPELV